MLSLTDRLDEDRLMRLAVKERKLNEGCDYPDDLRWWQEMARAYELRKGLLDLAEELVRAATYTNPAGEPDVSVMLAALSGVRDAINAYEEMR